MKPEGLITLAQKSVPVFRFAIAGAALLVLASMVGGGSIAAVKLVLPAVMIFVLAVAFVVLQWISKLKPDDIHWPSIYLVWLSLAVLTLVILLIVASAALDKPWPFRTYISSLVESEIKKETVDVPNSTKSNAEAHGPKPKKEPAVEQDPTKVNAADHDSRKEGDGDALHRWISAAKSARESGSVAKGRPLPPNVIEARSRFEGWWEETPLSQKKQRAGSDLFEGLSLCIRVYRIQEVEDTKKASSLKWAEEAITYFEEAADRRHIAESYMEKAAILLEMSDLRHTNPAEFGRLAETGEATMRRAAELAEPDQKAEAYRIWSTFYYNLARPAGGSLVQPWNNEYLLVSEARMREGYQLSPDSLKSVVQLARVIQKAAATPPQDVSKEWTKKLWEVQRALKARWRIDGETQTDPRSRMAPLNILGVLTMDAVLRSWQEAGGAPGFEEQKEFLGELDTTALPAQREFLSLVIGSELEEDYDYDANYDLARLYAVRLLVAESKGEADPGGDFESILKCLERARVGATTRQLTDALDSIMGTPCFRLLSDDRKAKLREVLSVKD